MSSGSCTQRPWLALLLVSSCLCTVSCFLDAVGPQLGRRGTDARRLSCGARGGGAAGGGGVEAAAKSRRKRIRPTASGGETWRLSMSDAMEAGGAGAAEDDEEWDGDYSLKIVPPPKWVGDLLDKNILEEPFVASKEGEPTKDELSDANLLRAMAEKCTDEQLNWLVWKALGYRFSPESGSWSNDKVFPKWVAKYPEPPDLIGVLRQYSREVDRPVLKANQQLVRSIPMDFKQSLKEQLSPTGFTGFMMDELTPNRTRRAQCTNFLCFFRKELWGVSIEELKRRRAAKQEAAAAAKDATVAEQPAFKPLEDE